MTAHPIDTEGFRGKHQVSDDEWADDIEHLEWALAEAVGRAEAAEHRAIRAEAQSAIRGRAVVIYRERAREAEAERDVAETFVDTVKELVSTDDRRIIGEIMARRKAKEATE